MKVLTGGEAPYAVGRSEPSCHGCEAVFTHTSDTITASSQARWAARTVRERVAFLRRARLAMASSAETFLPALAHLPRTGADSLTAELLPLLDAIRFLEREAANILAPRRLGARGRPLWMGGIQAEVWREPFGQVLVIGPSNFPLFLPGAQTMQALAAGNAVTWKPGLGGLAAAEMVAGFLREAGLPRGVLRITGESVENARAALAERPEKVIFTGSRETGQKVLKYLAETATPSVMELSGCDAVVVLPSAETLPGLDVVAKALAFGMRLNGGRVCMAPRRVLAPRAVLDLLKPLLLEQIASIPPVPLESGAAGRVRACVAEAQAAGARLLTDEAFDPAAQKPWLLEGVSPEMRIAREDLFAPVLSLVEIATPMHAADAVHASGLGLTAAIFGDPAEARALAAGLRVGTVLINDLIAPTADPRVPFPARGDSGLGSTRGVEGLLEMTSPKTLLVRRGGAMRHLEPTGEGDVPLLAEMIRTLHGNSLGATWGAMRRFASLARRRQG